MMMTTQNEKTIAGVRESESGENLLSIVVPAFNEQDVLTAFHARLASVMDALDMESEVLYVNDGSADKTLSVIRDLREQDPRIAILDLSRNFGKEIAMTAGLEHARGDAVIIIDADLQDPPELIPELVRHWRDGGRHACLGPEYFASDDR